VGARGRGCPLMFLIARFVAVLTGLLIAKALFHADRW
jgi:hypothetical protein